MLLIALLGHKPPDNARPGISEKIINGCCRHTMSPAVAAPSNLWNWYIDYLWNYDNNSWVATIAYGFRFCAILAILPTVILGLLVSTTVYDARARTALPSITHVPHLSQQDVTSYVIARTLGDPTASTCHKSTFAQTDPSQPDPTIDDGASGGAGTVPISGLPPSQGEDVSLVSAAGAIAEPATATASAHQHPATYFLDGDGEGEYEGAARLAGVGVFSPVPSMPGSPTLSRRRSFRREEESTASVSASGSVRHVLPESERGHERTASGGSGVNEGGESTSGESSFTLLEREESFEDPTHIRRRVPGPAGADADD